MKKRIPFFNCLLICLMILAGCTCKHTWIEPDCVTAKTCSDCGETESEPLGHSWIDATCEAPRTCSVCAAAEGESLPHIFTTKEHTVIERIPYQTSTCSVCGFQEALEGEAFISSYLSGSTWQYMLSRTDDVTGYATGVGYLTFGEGNTFTCVLGDTFTEKGTWEFSFSAEDEGIFFHYLIFTYEDGTSEVCGFSIDPFVEIEVFYLFDSDNNYIALFKTDISVAD